MNLHEALSNAPVQPASTQELAKAFINQHLKNPLLPASTFTTAVAGFLLASHPHTRQMFIDKYGTNRLLEFDAMVLHMAELLNARPNQNSLGVIILNTCANL